ncbi:unnamed protein product, partial [Ectocarpus fasciculatus]
QQQQSQERHRRATEEPNYSDSYARGGTCHAAIGVCHERFYGSVPLLPTTKNSDLPAQISLAQTMLGSDGLGSSEVQRSVTAAPYITVPTAQPLLPKSQPVLPVASGYTS